MQCSIVKYGVMSDAIKTISENSTKRMHVTALPTAVARTLRHTRQISFQCYARDDGLWDIDASITDVKTRDVGLAENIRRAGEPIHELHLRVTIDLQLNIIDAQAASLATPYPGVCDTIGDAYRQLIGLNLFKNFRQEVKARLGETAGCTHLTELCGVLPSAAIQAYAGDVLDTREGMAVVDKTGAAHVQPPFQLNRCHALAFDSPAVLQYYPKWYKFKPSK